MKKLFLLMLLTLGISFVHADNTAWAGLLLTDMPASLASHLNLAADEALMVINIAEGSPAEDAGLQRYDVIFRVNGDSFSGIEGFKKIIAGYLEKGSLPLTFFRKGARKNIELTLKPDPGEDIKWTLPDKKLNVIRKRLLTPGAVVLRDGSSMPMKDFLESDNFKELSPSSRDMIRKMAERAKNKKAESFRTIIPPSIWKTKSKTPGSVFQSISYANDEYSFKVMDGMLTELKSAVTGEVLLKNVPLSKIMNGEVEIEERARKLIEKTCNKVKSNVYTDFCAPSAEFDKEKALDRKNAEKAHAGGKIDLSSLKTFGGFSNINRQFRLNISKGTITDFRRGGTGELILENTPITDIETGKVKLPEDALLFLLTMEQAQLRANSGTR